MIIVYVQSTTQKRAANDGTQDVALPHRPKLARIEKHKSSSSNVREQPRGVLHHQANVEPEIQNTGLRLPFTLGELRQKTTSIHGAETGTRGNVSWRTLPMINPISNAFIPRPATDANSMYSFTVSSTGLGPINLVDSHCKIIKTRDPRGGFGYDPEANFTPTSSFASIRSFGSTRTAKQPPGTYRALFAEADDDDSKTIVGHEQDIGTKDDLHTLSQSFSSQTISSDSSFVVNPIINKDSSFNEVLVFRYQDDTSFSSPSTKFCSALANCVDIVKVQKAAEDLLGSHPDSESIVASVSSRLEHMIKVKTTAIRRAAKKFKRKPVVPKPVDSVMQLRCYLGKQKESRMEMDEAKEEIELELAWLDWFVEAAQCGVLHLKIPGCTCRPELFAEDEDENPWA